MRVLLVSTSERTGGAAVAANRLKEALTNNGIKAKMLVRDKETDDVSVAPLPHNSFRQFHFLRERLSILLSSHLSRRHLFDIDIANSGADITGTQEFREADIIHLHWINQGMLSLKGIRKILDSKKPVVWTMHDMWPATALCHYTRGCSLFKTSCHDCQLLPGGGSPSDLSSRVWQAKRRMLQDRTIHFVACSRWLAAKAKESGLLKGQSITSIPNPIDTRIFRPSDKLKCRQALSLPLDKKIILFVSQRLTDERKGMKFFIEAVNSLAKSDPETAQSAVIALLGGHAEEVAPSLNLPVYPLGYVSDERKIADVYNAADVYVLPSLEDNLPNTIMESMACGLPSVAFKVGGIPEMIDHLKSGYVAALRDSADLANGIRQVAWSADYQNLSQNAVKKVLTSYSWHSVAVKYIEVYNQAIACKRYRL